jgi:hypothetical protein
LTNSEGRATEASPNESRRSDLQLLGRMVLWILVGLLVVMALQLIMAPGSQGLWLGIPLLLAAIYAAVRLRRRKPATG